MPFFSFIIVVSIAVAIILSFIYFLFKRLERTTSHSGELVEWMKDLGQRVESSTVNVDKKLSQNMEVFNSRLDRAAYVIAEVQKSIGEFSEMGRSMKELQEFLQSPKLRGNIGEQVLKELLSQYFP